MAPRPFGRHLAAAAVAALATVMVTPTAAAFSVAPYFDSHAVIQADAPAPVFGTSSAGDVVTVTLNGNKYTGAADANGAWTVVLPSTPASTSAVTLSITSAQGASATLTDVLFGDVYVIAGEGNVLMTASSIWNASSVIASADAYASIRLFQAAAPAPDVKKRAQAPTRIRHGNHYHDASPRHLAQNTPSSSSHLPTATGSAGLPWTPSSSAVVGAGNWTTFSAVSYLFGKYLVDALSSTRPVGLIVAAAGGSPFQAWVGPQTAASCPGAPAAPHYSNSSLFTALLAPMAQGPLSLSGVLLWQGETNTAMAVPDSTEPWYACALPSFLGELRGALKNPSLFVGVVQLPPVAAQFWTDAVPLFRTIQASVNTPPTAVVSAIDTGDQDADFTYLHSRNKDVVARRLANAALTVVYKKAGFPYLPTGGTPTGAYVSEDKNNVTTVSLSFDSTLASPLFLDPTIVCPGGFPQGDPNNLWISYVCQAFRVRSDASDGFKWYNTASAQVGPDGKTVVLTVQLPRAGVNVSQIEYAWAPWTAAALHDANGTPIQPFQTNITNVQRTRAMTPETQLLMDRLLEHREQEEAEAGPAGGARRLQSWLDLEPLVWRALPLGSVRPAGWLKTQIDLTVNGLGGSIFNFYPPVAHSPWINVTCPWPGGCQDTDEGEDFGYALQWAVSLAVLSDPDCTGAFCQQISGFIDMVLQNQDPKSHWIGPPAGDGDGNSEFAVWLVVTGLWQWWEATGDVRIKPAVYAHLQESYRRLAEVSPLVAWAQSRAQDYIWLLQTIMDADPDNLDGMHDFLTRFSWLLAGQQNVPWEVYYSNPAYFPTGNSGWNFSNHGVNIAEGLKSGAVLYRMTQSPFAADSSHFRLSVLDEYHGSPTGGFLADETLADSMPSHGQELCAVVEAILSLNVVHEAQGDATFADRAERIAYNALPGTWTADAWAHQYLHQPNAISALHLEDHIWLADGPDAVTFGVAPNYPCCAANGPGGWSFRFLPRAVHASSDGGVALSLLGPLTAVVPVPSGNSVSLTVDTEYPFGDSLDISIADAPASMPFYIRIPDWATNANVSVDGAPAVAAGPNGTMYRIVLASAGSHSIHVELNPEIYVDSIGVLYNGAIAVHRGALLYALRLGESPINVTQNWTTNNPQHPVAIDFTLNSTTPWNYALVFDPTDPAGPSKFFNFQRLGPVNSTFPWDHETPNLQITAQARQLPWPVQNNAPVSPPTSPACTTPGNCGNPVPVTLVPFGATHIRMSVLPWTPQ
jgi:hypothetical protein